MAAVATLSIKYKDGEYFWYLWLWTSRDYRWVKRFCHHHPQVKYRIWHQDSLFPITIPRDRASQEAEKKKLKSMASKDWDLVPEGQYCYLRYSNEALSCTIPCLYWRWKNGDGWCDLLQETDFLLWDQCKICGINDPDEF